MYDSGTPTGRNIVKLKNILRTLAPVAVGAALAAGVSVMPAQAATAQFTAAVQAPNRILSGHALYFHEKITVAGFPEVVTSVQNNGGGTVAWLQFALPSTARTLAPVTVKVS